MTTTLTSEDLANIQSAIFDEAGLEKLRVVVREEIQTGVFEGVGLQKLRAVVRDEVGTTFETRGREIVREEVKAQIQPLEGKVDALQNDVIELYGTTKKIRGEMRRGFQHVNRRLGRLEDSAGLPAMKF
jgi:hypothetical protein